MKLGATQNLQQKTALKTIKGNTIQWVASNCRSAALIGSVVCNHSKPNQTGCSMRLAAHSTQTGWN